jgi:gliding motility-associated lipoprotein GldD
MRKYNWGERVVVCLCCTFLFIACDTDYSPKRKGYNRLDIPEHAYQGLPDTLPYYFEYSKHAQLLSDTSYISNKDWVEIYYPSLLANIHITYLSLEEMDLKELIEDAYFLTSKHQIKASAINDNIIVTPSGKTVSIAELEGDVPSQFQFYTTDSVKHFFRGALYFNTKVQNDSLAPAIEYVKLDIMNLINTLQWRE